MNHLRIGFTTGYRENYWAGWPWVSQYGGSEHLVIELAAELATQGHTVTVRLPYPTAPRSWRGVGWVGADHQSERYDLLFCFDDYERRDDAERVVLVSCRSDPPRHRNFDRRIYLSKVHAELSGEPDGLHIGGGVRISDYKDPQPRIERRVLYSSSPDRGGHHAERIGRRYDFLATYRRDLARPVLVRIQQSAQVLIHPCDPTRPSEMFCMAALEALAAGTPIIVSDADALPSLWGDVATVLPRPIDYSAWSEGIDRLLDSPKFWAETSKRGQLFARSFDWSVVARKYLVASM